MSDETTLVYAGRGSSHSWTWLADLFESRNILDVRFTDSRVFAESLASGVSRVIISGGDGFMIADSIGLHGFAHLKGFIHRGGEYVGMCAGAYLPLPSSIPPFNQFNLSHTKINNIEFSSSSSGSSPRLSVSYGSCSVIHPVRGEIAVDYQGKRLLAPIFGGPIFREPEREMVLLRYSDFTPSTEFQTDTDRAQSIMLGRPGGIESVHGKGRLVLLGPHLEHPRYREANDVFLDLLHMKSAEPYAGVGPESDGVGRQILAGSIADLKVSVLGLENRSFLVGKKLWDGSRFLELIAAIEKRVDSLNESEANSVRSKLDQMREILIRSPDASIGDPGEGPELLVDAARLCVDSHFAALRENR
jgi:glutamine amidotransferase-like uncharacterized protein